MSATNHLHPRNKHQGNYQFDTLIQINPELKNYIIKNFVGEDSIDFSNPKAVYLLNQTLLKQQYQLDYWEIPTNYLCPPIPGRADYIHHLADLLRNHNFGKIPTGEKIVGYDIGTGSNCIYPIIGSQEYDWNFIGSDIDAEALKNATEIIHKNERLKRKIELRKQNNSNFILRTIISNKDFIDFSMCNPPFHASAEEAKKGSIRKNKNLGTNQNEPTQLNFGGQQNELWCKGGELEFIKKYIAESKIFAKNCYWFTTLVSKQSNLKHIETALIQANVAKKLLIPMGQGNKSSRIVAWTFLNNAEQNTWKLARWK